MPATWPRIVCLRLLRMGRRHAAAAIAADATLHAKPLRRINCMKPP
jgi:hypothetical protein